MDAAHGELGGFGRMSKVTEFKIGERVSGMGRKGTVTSVGRGPEDYPIRVQHDDGEEEFYTADGRFHIGHTRPSLKKLKKKKARYFKFCSPKGASGVTWFEPNISFIDLNDHWFKDMGTKKPKGAE